ncbi:S-layer homology domain-containing protein [Sporosarcina cascadiensis]|uniref:S-layer homology domain-containing protein n=1 Tax=Sporosarcina cascadiensis TaxID=2660747 RepID=UPI00129B71C6|nr:S-layer homology domain-containing protein [Sporosarcina cascadiensis]
MKVQSKKYSKYLTGVASAALVASAVAPVVSAADFNDVADTNSHKAAIDALSNAKVISGYPDGSFKPNKTLSRSDVVKLMGKWLVSMGYEIPKDYKTNPRFTDLTSKSNDELLQSAAIVRDNNVFKGYEDGSLKAAGSITRENMAIVLVRAYDAVNKTDLISYVKEQKFDKDVVDLAKAKAEARTAIDVLDYFDITNPAAPNFRPKETTTRAQFASFLYKTSQVEKPGEETPEAPAVAEVTSVEAVGEKELTIKGKDLGNLKAEQLTIEGNEVASFTANANGTQGTVELKNPLTSGKEMTLNYTVKTEGEPDQVTPFKFTYTYEVAKVVATTTQVNAGTEGQVLGFNVNGAPADMKKLKEAGYTVEFQATKDVFANKATGELNKDKLVKGTSFSYKVTVSKDGKPMESELVDVKVVEYGSYVSSIDEVTVTQDGVTVKNGKLALGTTATVKATKATTVNGTVVTDPANATYSSSKPSVATVTSNGTITPISTGDVNIIVKVGDVTKEVSLSVVAGSRTPAKVEAAASNVLEGKTQDINLTITDQYGDMFKGDVTLESKDSTVGTVLPSAQTVTDGKTTIKVTGVKAGTTEIQVKFGGNVVGTVPVTVSDDAQAANTKLEPATAGKDLTLDIMKGSQDSTVDLVWNKYNQNGTLVGQDPIKVDTYTIVSSDPSVAKVGAKTAAGVVTIEGVKAGTATIQIKEGDIVRASATITVKNSTPTISAVNFENTQTVKTTALDVKVLKEAGITLTSTEHKAKIDGKNIYIDLGGTTGKYDEDADILIGEINTSFSGASDAITDIVIEDGSIKGKVKAGTEGTLVVSVTNAEDSSKVATKDVSVKVPVQ